MPENLNQNGQFKELSREELLDLFKHWDQLGNTKETVLVTLALAPFAATCAAWDKMSPLVIVCVGCFSYFVYVYHLHVMHRFGELQDNTLNLVWDQSNIRDIVNKPGRGLGIRNRRVIFLPLLGLAWITLSYLKSISLPPEQRADSSTPFFYVVMVVVDCFYLVLTASYFHQFWKRKGPTNRQPYSN